MNDPIHKAFKYDILFSAVAMATRILGCLPVTDIHDLADNPDHAVTLVTIWWQWIIMRLEKNCVADKDRPMSVTKNREGYVHCFPRKWWLMNTLIFVISIFVDSTDFNVLIILRRAQQQYVKGTILSPKCFNKENADSLHH